MGPHWHAPLEAAGHPALSVIVGRGIKNPDTPYICLHLIDPHLDSLGALDGLLDIIGDGLSLGQF